MTFLELRNETSELLNFNASQSDQDFTSDQIKSAVNRAYRREYVRARQEGTRRFFKAVKDFTWAAGAVTLDLTDVAVFPVLGISLVGQQLVRITDVTGSAPGEEIVFSDNGGSGDVHWLTNTVLQWGTVGPSSSRTLRAEYFPRATAMDNDIDEPVLIPYEHRDLISYSAAIDLRNRADEMAPQAWLMERESLRMDFWKDISKNRPHSDTTGITNTYQGWQT